MYLQEVGRAGRDGLASTATMYWCPADIAGNIPHMTDAMRDYVKSTSCRRKWLANHFNDPEPENVVPRHMCCDVCAQECECGCEKSQESPEDNEEGNDDNTTIDQSTANMINILINQYFHIENSQLQSPFAMSTTLLSNTLAETISKRYNKYSSAAAIQTDFPNVQQTYCDNIAAVIHAYLSKVQS